MISFLPQDPRLLLLSSVKFVLLPLESFCLYTFMSFFIFHILYLFYISIYVYFLTYIILSVLNNNWIPRKQFLPIQYFIYVLNLMCSEFIYFSRLLYVVRKMFHDHVIIIHHTLMMISPLYDVQNYVTMFGISELVRLCNPIRIYVCFIMCRIKIHNVTKNRKPFSPFPFSSSLVTINIAFSLYSLNGSWGLYAVYYYCQFLFTFSLHLPSTLLNYCSSLVSIMAGCQIFLYLVKKFS